MTGWNFGGQNLSYATLTNANLTNAGFQSANLSGVTLSGCTVAGADFGYTGLTASQLYNTASYMNQNLQGIGLEGNNLTGWSFLGQDMTNSNLASTTLVYAVLANAKLAGANCSYATLTNASLINANLTSVNFQGATLINANLANATLANAKFQSAVLTNANLSNTDLVNANCANATLTNTILNNAIVTGADFGYTNPTTSQLCSTTSYQNGSLQGIGLEGNNLSGWTFTGQNMTNANLSSANLSSGTLTNANLANANFQSATLTNANFNGADLRGAMDPNGTGTFFGYGASLINAIDRNGAIQGLNLNAANPLLVVHDYAGLTPIPITINSGMTVSSGGTLGILFDGPTWGSTISFAAGIPVTLGGNLTLGLDSGIDPSVVVGHSFQVFNWSGVTPTGQFSVVNNFPASCLVDTSQLYSTGNVSFVGHSAANLAVVSGNNQAVIVGATAIAGLSLANGTAGQCGLASLDVNSLGVGVTGLTGGELIASGSSQPYAASLNTLTLGTQTQTFSLNAGDDHTLPGAFAATNISTGVTLTVLGHASPALSVVGGKNQTVIVGAAASAGLSLANGLSGQQGLASLDVNSLGAGVTGLTGDGVVASGSSQAYTAELNTGTTGPQSQTFVITAGDDHTLLGASAPVSVSATAAYTVLDHSVGAFVAVGSPTTLNLNFGTILQGSGSQSLQYQVQNLFAQYRAALDLDSVTVESNPQGVFSTNAAPFSNLPSGSVSAPINISLNTSTTGTFTGQFLLNVSDEKDLIGHAGASVLTLNVEGSVSTNTTSVGGGTAVVGGVQSTFSNIVTPGTLTSTFLEPATPTGLSQAIGAVAVGQIDFACQVVPRRNFGTWISMAASRVMRQ